MLNRKTVKKRFSKHFADIFRVQKWMNSLYCDFCSGCGNSAKIARFFWMGFNNFYVQTSIAFKSGKDILSL